MSQVNMFDLFLTFQLYCLWLFWRFVYVEKAYTNRIVNLKIKVINRYLFVVEQCHAKQIILWSNMTHTIIGQSPGKYHLSIYFVHSNILQIRTSLLYFYSLGLVILKPFIATFFPHCLHDNSETWILKQNYFRILYNRCPVYVTQFILLTIWMLYL
jgi:hypothetical protein